MGGDGSGRRRALSKNSKRKDPSSMQTRTKKLKRQDQNGFHEPIKVEKEEKQEILGPHFEEFGSVSESEIVESESEEEPITFEAIQKQIQDWKRDQPEMCAVCLSDEVEGENVLLICSNIECDVSVHLERPKDDWKCEKCESKEKVRCVLCPDPNGVFKRTTEGKWAHMSCAQWVPGAFFQDEENLANIEIKEISPKLWNLECNVCQIKYGVCVPCDAGLCKNSVHATCALKYNLIDDEEIDEEMAYPYFVNCKTHSQNQPPRPNELARWLKQKPKFYNEEKTSHEKGWLKNFASHYHHFSKNRENESSRMESALLGFLVQKKELKRTVGQMRVSNKDIQTKIQQTKEATMKLEKDIDEFKRSLVHFYRYSIGNPSKEEPSEDEKSQILNGVFQLSPPIEASQPCSKNQKSQTHSPTLDSDEKNQNSNSRMNRQKKQYSKKQRSSNSISNSNSNSKKYDSDFMDLDSKNEKKDKKNKKDQKENKNKKDTEDKVEKKDKKVPKKSNQHSQANSRKIFPNNFHQFSPNHSNHSNQFLTMKLEPSSHVNSQYLNSNPNPNPNPNISPFYNFDSGPILFFPPPPLSNFDSRSISNGIGINPLYPTVYKFENVNPIPTPTPNITPTSTSRISNIHSILNPAPEIETKITPSFNQNVDKGSKTNGEHLSTHKTKNPQFSILKQCQICQNLDYLFPEKGNPKTNSKLIECNECKNRFHYGCLDPPMIRAPSRGYIWYCETCDGSSDEEEEEEVVSLSSALPFTRSKNPRRSLEDKTKESLELDLN